MIYTSHTVLGMVIMTMKIIMIMIMIMFLTPMMMLTCPQSGKPH